MDKKIEYYSAREGIKLPVHSTAWMNLKTLCSVKKTTHKEPHFVGSYLYEIPRIVVKFMEIEGRISS